MEGVESNDRHGGAAADRRKSNRRNRWACTFILANNFFQNMAYFGVSTNLVNYLKYRLHEGSKSAANNVTNWEGTGSIAPLVAGYLADAFLGRYWTIVLSMVISAVVRSSPPPAMQGYGVLAASASVIRLESAALYAGMYLVALGGVLEPIMAPFGADQFDDGEDDQRGRRQSSFFNWFYLSLNCGSLVGGTVLVWVQTSVGWGVGYGVPAIFSALSVAVFLAGTATYRRDQPPGGSPLTRIAQVVVAAVRKFDVEIPSDSSMLYESDAVDGMPAIHGRRRLLHTGQFRFLDRATVKTAGEKAAQSPWRLCTVTQVEELKCVLRLLPVWATGIIYAAAYTQVTTTFILQGDTLDRSLGRFKVPAAALSIFHTLSVILWVALYDRAIVPLARRVTRHDGGFTQLARMGVGLVILTVAMAAAGALEAARRRLIARPSVFWQVPQYAVVGASEVFTLIGQMEFFYDQAPDAMRSLCSALSSTSFALGDYASSALVVVAARRGGAPGWIPDDINRGHLDYFFWLLTALCVANFAAYLLIARWYTYKKTVD
ncbi:putative peptide transport protein [Oryza sativa Japonica Group]|uniref:Peptide transport protein n=1 Tax=Oryza sativa subsp. japonica TaxID=39947 RepID=Q8RZ74_ORYSJ|nr:putative peptide transport protein [Oryza sativa Japonica Group]BAD82781.1 putative peptide transport protein [Oryza sativa Japonica Group]